MPFVTSCTSHARIHPVSSTPDHKGVPLRSRTGNLDEELAWTKSHGTPVNVACHLEQALVWVQSNGHAISPLHPTLKSIVSRNVPSCKRIGFGGAGVYSVDCKLYLHATCACQFAGAHHLHHCKISYLLRWVDSGIKCSSFKKGALYVVHTFVVMSSNLSIDSSSFGLEITAFIFSRPRSQWICIARRSEDLDLLPWTKWGHGRGLADSHYRRQVVVGCGRATVPALGILVSCSLF